MLCLVDIPGRSALFCREMDQQWVCGREELSEGTGGVEGDEAMVRIYCMTEEIILSFKNKLMGLESI